MEKYTVSHQSVFYASVSATFWGEIEPAPIDELIDLFGLSFGGDQGGRGGASDKSIDMMALGLSEGLKSNGFMVGVKPLYFNMNMELHELFYNGGIGIHRKIIQ